jgi:hypothetical protein
MDPSASLRRSHQWHIGLISPHHGGSTMCSMHHSSPPIKTTAHGPNFSHPPPDLIDGEEKYKVERIISHRHHGRARVLQYLVKWKGYPESDNTWEPATQIHTPDLLKTYHRRRPLEHIKAMLSQSSNAIFPHWTSPAKRYPHFISSPSPNPNYLLYISHVTTVAQASLTSSSANNSTTPTRSWTPADIQRPI